MQLSLVNQDNDATCLRCAGNVSQSYFEAGVSNPLEDLLGPACYRQRILLDLGGAALIDSSGVGWLINCHKRCIAEGGKLILHSVPPMVDQVLRLLHMHKLLTIKPDHAAALAAVRGTA